MSHLNLEQKDHLDSFGVSHLAVRPVLGGDTRGARSAGKPAISNSLNCAFRRVFAAAALFAGISVTPGAMADTSVVASQRDSALATHVNLVNPAVGTFAGVPVKKYALGVRRFDLDTHTEILGWQINQSLYFGRQDGLDSGLTLVWQQDANQVSVSKDGLRLTRRF